MPPRIIDVIRRINGGLRAYLRPDDIKFAGMFDVEQGLRRGCVLAPLLFNTLFPAVPRAAEKGFASDKATPDSMVRIIPKNENGKQKRRMGQAGHADGQGKDKELQTLIVVLHADDAGMFHNDVTA